MKWESEYRSLLPGSPCSILCSPIFPALPGTFSGYSHGSLGLQLCSSGSTLNLLSLYDDLIEELYCHIRWRTIQFSSVSRVQFFATAWTPAHQPSLSITNSQSLLKLTSITLDVMPFNHLILCCPLLFLPSVFPSIRVFSNESVLHIRWPNYRSFSCSISPSNEYSALIY